MPPKPKTAPKDKSLESWIWDAAFSIRGAKDAPRFKDYIFPLIFIKRFCDIFDDKLNRIASPSIALFLNKAKPKEPKGKVFMVNASQVFEKGDPKNFIPMEAKKTDKALSKILKQLGV